MDVLFMVVCIVLVVICIVMAIKLNDAHEDNKKFLGRINDLFNQKVQYRDSLERIKQVLKEKEMALEAQAHLNTGCSWTVAVRNDKGNIALLKGFENDFPSRAEAVVKAQALAKENPNKVFIVMGPSDEVKAVIPVEVTEWGRGS